MFQIDKWDGLAKIGKYKVNGKEIITPALFPVVDPFKQDVPIDRLQKDFGFDQVITSAYLMSKRMKDKPLKDYPKIHEYLNFDGLVMMDSGAYQVMLYGDIDLGVINTLELQNYVKTDIGVIMDHPIGIDVSYDDAKKRVETTLENIHTSINKFGDLDVNWTLPIQGGKYLELMNSYLDDVCKDEIRKHFNFYALGSVVQVMIHQRYDILVDMIATTKLKLPVDKPLHLFGAGHPAMFALATFLGCDTFDSAAYILMAKDSRYMTVEGTYHLSDLKEFPCYCKICMEYTPEQMQSMKRAKRTNLIAQHNLYVSNGEIMRVRNAIRYGRLWDLVQQRAAAVPNLAKATRKAIEYVTTGKLKDLYISGIPVYNNTATRMMRKVDIHKGEITRVKEDAFRLLNDISPTNIICLAYKMNESVYNRATSRLMNIDTDKLICMLLPPFGFIPARIYDLYPIGQLSHDLEFEDFDTEYPLLQLRELKDRGLNKLTLLVNESWPEKQLASISEIVDTQIRYCNDPIRELIKLTSK